MFSIGMLASSAYVPSRQAFSLFQSVRQQVLIPYGSKSKKKNLKKNPQHSIGTFVLASLVVPFIRGEVVE